MSEPPLAFGRFGRFAGRPSIAATSRGAKPTWRSLGTRGDFSFEKLAEIARAMRSSSPILLAALALPACASLAVTGGGRCARRAVFALAAPCLVLPRPARAGLFGPDTVGELRPLVKGRDTLLQLGGQLERGELGSADETAVYIFRLSTGLGPSPEQLQRATSAIGGKLSQSDRERAAELAAAFPTRVDGMKAAARERAGKRELIGSVSAAALALDGILELASAGGYGVPVPADTSFSTEQYFGIFSCEGQGLQRLPGSNQCGDRIKPAGK